METSADDRRVIHRGRAVRPLPADRLNCVLSSLALVRGSGE